MRPVGGGRESACFSSVGNSTPEKGGVSGREAEPTHKPRLYMVVLLSDRLAMPRGGVCFHGDESLGARCVCVGAELSPRAGSPGVRSREPEGGKAAPAWEAAQHSPPGIEPCPGKRQS